MEEIIALYKQGVDRTLIRENLKLTPAQRLEKLGAQVAFVEEVRRAGARARALHFDHFALLDALVETHVELIIVGSTAAVYHGAALATFDFSCVYERGDANLARVVRALRPLAPHLRGAPPGLPFIFDERMLRIGLNFTFSTSRGDLDLLGEVTGGGTYAALLPHSTIADLAGRRCRIVDLDTLIHLKRAAGRVKDLEAIAELEIIREELARDP